MSKKKWLMLVGAMSMISHALFFIAYAQQPPKGPPAPTPKPTAVKPDIIKKFEQSIRQAGEKLKSLKAALQPQKILTALKKATYKESTRFAFTSPQGDSITFDWGYGSHGSIIEGFKGFVVKPILKDIPPFLNAAVANALSKIGLKFSPAQEWLLKVALLADGFAGNKIEANDFAWEFNALLLKLLHTTMPDGKTRRYQTLSQVLKDINPLIKKLLELVPLKINENTLTGGKETGEKKPILQVLDTYFKTFADIVAKDFSQKMEKGKFVKDKAYKLDSSKLSNPQARKQLLAIGFKALVFYDELKKVYEKTSAGKTAAETKKKAFLAAAKLSLAKKLKAKSDAISVYNTALPGYDTLKEFISIELIRLLDRLKDTRYKNAIGKIFDPILGLIGLPKFSELIAGYREEAPKPPPPPPLPLIELPTIEEKLPVVTAEEITEEELATAEEEEEW